MEITAETVRAKFERALAGDMDALEELMHEDFVQDWPQSGERVRSKAACLAIYRNYPGGSPTLSVRRVTGSGDVWVAEADMMYGDKKVFGVSILEFRDGKLIRETDYFGDPFPAPAWRSQWVEIVGEPVTA